MRRAVEVVRHSPSGRPNTIEQRESEAVQQAQDGVADPIGLIGLTSNVSIWRSRNEMTYA
jgi:hypothetical protein